VFAEGFVGSFELRGSYELGKGVFEYSKQNKRQGARLTLYSNKSAIERGR
jgi:hypothetical protein